DHPTPGDADLGERFFTGAGNCSSCHMVRGRGGVLGPDLSNLGRERRVLQIERALREPGTVPPPTGGGRGGASAPSFKAVSVRLRDGRIIRGLAKYETLFDIGVQGLDGTFHSLTKTQITALTTEPSI